MTNTVTPEEMRAIIARTIARARCLEPEKAPKPPQPIYTTCGLKDLRAAGEYHTRRETGRAISMADWASKFMPFTNPRDGSEYFTPTEPLDAAFLKQMGDEHIWTDFDLNLAFHPDIEEIRYPGRYKVDRIGYLVTMRAWADEDRDLAVYDYDK